MNNNPKLISNVLCASGDQSAGKCSACGVHKTHDRSRRSLLKLGLAAALWSPFSVFAARKPEKTRPQAGDRLTFAFGDRSREIILNQDIDLNSPPVAAYPKDTTNNIVRDRSRLNMVLVLRLAPDSLTKAMAPHAADGLIAYSAVCTHTGCTVEGWNGDTRHMICPCHGSLYDAANGATVLKGPAPKPLAMLPLRIEDGAVVVAGNFSRKVGFQQ